MSDTALPPAWLVVLAIYAEQPRHPYQAYKVLRERYEDRHVGFSPGTMYNRVKNLASAGLLTEVATEVAGNRPERTVYAITEPGRHRLISSLRDHLVTIGDAISIRVALAEATHLPEAEVADLLRQRLVRLDEHRAALASGRAQITEWGVPRGYVLDVELSSAQLAAERQVIASIVADLDAGRLRWPEPGSFTPPERITIPGSSR